MRKIALWAGVALVPFGWSPAMAQSAVDGQAAQGSAEGATASESGLETITVTAQRFAETVQSAPLAITALSSDTLADRNIVNAQDFNAIAPNVTFGELNGFARVNIRGIGNQNFFTGGDPSVSMYVDGAVISQAAAQLSSFFDLERVEVLRGPQGTLYGRNATGGSVNLITNKPTSYLDGYARVGIGNYDHFQFEGAVGGPVADNVNARVALFRQTRGGFGINEFTGADIDNVNRLYARGMVEFDLEEHNLLLSVQYGKEDDTNYQVRVFGQGNPGNAGRVSGVILGGTLAVGERNVNSEAGLRNDRKSLSLTGTYRYEMSDVLSLQSITNYLKYDHDYVIDIDGTQIYYADVQQKIETEQFSQEVQVNYVTDALKVVAGLYYFKEDIFGDNNLGPSRPTFLAPAGPPGNFWVSLLGNVDVEAIGAFMQGTYELTTGLSLTAGIRYSTEDRNGTGVSSGPTTLIPSVSVPRSISEDDVSFKLGLDYQITDDVLAYASFSQGFKSGVILVGAPDAAASPEFVDAYEVGIKGDYLDSNLRLNLAAFYYDYTDLQVSQLLVGANTPTVTNAASAKVYGLEAEATALLGERVRVDSRIGYLDATFTTFFSRNPRIAPPAASPQFNLTGNRLPYAPKITWTNHVEVELPLGALEDEVSLTAMGDLTYTSRTDFSVFNEVDLSQGANTRVDASLKLEDADGVWSLTAWVKNLTNQDTFANLTIGGGTSTNRAIYGVMTPPRTYGLTAGFSF